MTDTYRPIAVTMVYGTHTLEGYMDGVFIEVEDAEDDFEGHTGSQGEYSRVQNHNDVAKVTATIKMTSVTNDVLEAEHAIDVATGKNTKPLLVKSSATGKDICFIPAAFIIKRPKKDYSNKITARAWVFEGKARNTVGAVKA